MFFVIKNTQQKDIKKYLFLFIYKLILYKYYDKINLVILLILIIGNIGQQSHK